MSMIIGGEITEIVGALSSGRTSLLVSGMRDVTRRGAVAALVDVDDAFDPVSAARAGVDLRRVLWVRCGGRRDSALRAADLLLRCPGFALVALDLGETPPRLPLTRAFRLRLSARRTGAALVILASRRVAGAAAALAVRASRCAVRWGGPGAAPTRLDRLGTMLRIVRLRGGVAVDSTPGDGDGSRAQRETREEGSEPSRAQRETREEGSEPSRAQRETREEGSEPSRAQREMGRYRRGCLTPSDVHWWAA